MLIAIQVLNNIIAYRLLIVYYKVSSNSYYNQITNTFSKLLDPESVENTVMITVLIFLILCIYIRPTRLIENTILNDKFDVNGRYYTRSISLNSDNSAKIKKGITTNKDNKDK